LIVPYRVLLPKWVFENEKQVMTRAKRYMQRYPHYSLIRIENGFAICDKRIEDNK